MRLGMGDFYGLSAEDAYLADGCAVAYTLIDSFPLREDAQSRRSSLKAMRLGRVLLKDLGVGIGGHALFCVGGVSGVWIPPL